MIRPVLLALLVAAAAPALASAQGTPDQTIDAKTDPAGAGKTLDLCAAELSNCQWVSDATVKPGYGPVRIIGDVLYNCADKTMSAATALTATGFTEDRAESTSLTESVSLEASLAILGLEKSSVEFKAFSSQASSFDTAYTVTSTVTVPPGDKGFTTYRVLGGNVNGSTYVTDGVDLIKVTGIDLTFPGFSTGTNDSQIRLISNTLKMTDADKSNFCLKATGVLPTAQAASRAPEPTFRVVLCDGGDCHSRRVTGSWPAYIRRGKAALVRDGKTVARGKVVRGRVRLATASVDPGTYDLIIDEPPTRHTRRVHAHQRTHVEVTF
jgi:hypothetical protein